ncbi:Ig-like domain-containing protein [Pantoea trifolii]|uniref:Ig-like domain-containing protein n=1 Tax=Candidatus Pantoea symbiotica TaxID=1884370 RepID=UPI00241311D0|nr:Ig-like domain-containing protein [Pantoea rodasii]
MSSPVNVIVVEGKNITRSAELPVQSGAAPVRIQAAKGAKYLFTAGKDGAVEQHVIVRRSGKNLQVFLDGDDDQPELIIENYYDHPGELAGMGSDGQYHTFISEGTDHDAFMLLNDGGTAPLMSGSATTVGLSGLSLAAGGLSTGWLIAGAVGGLLALGGIAAAAGGGGGGGGDDTPPAPAPAPAPVSLADLAITDATGSQTGTITDGGVTDDARPVFSGSGTPGNTVRVYDNGQLVGSAHVGDDGRWQWQPEASLAAGSHDFSFAEMNRDGVEGDRSDSIGFELDLTAPARVSDLTLTDDAGASRGPVMPGDTINDSTPTFAGKAEPGATVEIRDNGELIGTALVAADGSWSFTPSPALASGEHHFSVIVVDPAGNKGLPVNLGPVMIDDTLIDTPAFSQVLDGNGNPLQSGDASNASPLQLGGSGTPGDTVTVTVDGQPVGTVIIGADGHWQYELPLSEEGAFDIGFIVTTPDGENVGQSDDFRFEFDTTAPDAPSMDGVSVTDADGNPLEAGDETRARSPLFSGTAEPGDIVRLYDGDTLVGSALAGADGRWDITVPPLNEGSHQFRTETEDRAGNVSDRSDSFELIVDITPPDAAADVAVTDGNGNLVGNGDALNSGELIFSGTALQGETVYLWDGDVLVGTLTLTADGQWQIPVEMTEEREYHFRTEVRDPAGNSSGMTDALDASFDTTPPVATDDTLVKDGADRELSAGDATNNGELTFSGSAQHGEVVYLWDGDVLMGTATVGADGQWQIPAEMIEEREYNFRTEIVDAAGNSSGLSDSLTLEYDVSAPAPVSFDEVNDENGDPLFNDSSTNSTRPVFNGTGTQGDIVYLVDDVTQQRMGSALVDENGEWSIKPDEAMLDGEYNLRLDVMDPAGNLTIGNNHYALEIDTVAPGAPKNIVLSNEPGLTGEAGSVDGLALVIIQLDGEEVGSVFANEDGSWSWSGDATMADGSYEFSAIAVDKANNRSESSTSYSYEVNTTKWDLNGGQQGWQAAGDYQRDTAYTNWNNGRFNAGTGPGFNFAGDVIYQLINVEAGKTYLFSFEGLASSTIDFARLGIEVDGVSITQGYTPLSNTTKTISGEFTASVSGEVRIAIVNENGNSGGNDFILDNLALRESYLATENENDVAGATGEFNVQGYSLLLNDDVLHFDLTSIVEADQDIQNISLINTVNHTLNISAADVLALGHEDLFLESGIKQLMINGDAGDVVNLETLIGTDVKAESWNTQGQITVGGVVYDVWQDGNQQVELLIQQGMQIQQD